MKYIFFICCMTLCSFQLHAQSKAEREKAKIEAQIQEQKADFINDVVNSFELDDFQKHILTQRLGTYYEELTKIGMMNILSFEKKALINDLDNTHFKDFEDMLGKDFVNELLEKAKGNEKVDSKKKKKKKRKKAKN